MTDKKRKLKLNLYGTDEEFQSLLQKIAAAKSNTTASSIKILDCALSKCLDASSTDNASETIQKTCKKENASKQTNVCTCADFYNSKFKVSDKMRKFH